MSQLTKDDWFWIILVPVVLLVFTFGTFIVWLHVYAITIFTAYFIAKWNPNFFDRGRRNVFVTKVLILSLTIFFTLFYVNNYIWRVFFKGS